MDDYLSNKPDNFVDDPEKLYRLRIHEAQQAKKLNFVDSKSEDQGSSESPKNSPPQSPRENRLPPMGDQPQERKIGGPCTPNIISLPILNLAEIGRPFEIKTSPIRMVQHSPFTGKEDPNHHLQAFIQLCQTFNMDRVTQDQMRARLFPFSLLRKALQWFHSQPTETVQDWNALMRAFIKEYYSSGKTRVYLTVSNRPDYHGNRPYRPGPVTVPVGYQPVGLKFFEFEFQKLKNVEKSLKILRDLLSLMVSNLLQTLFI
jgi:hypothetical protein